MTVSFSIPGRPIAKQRVRTTTKTGKHVAYTPQRTKDFENLVAGLARDEGALMLVGSLRVEIHISTRRPLRGDLDNYAKSLLDGIVKGRLIKDDSDIDQLVISRSVIPWENDRTLLSVEVLS